MVPCTEIQNYSSKAERRPRRGAVSLMGGNGIQQTKPEGLEAVSARKKTSQDRLREIGIVKSKSSFILFLGELFIVL